jgi:hypothetical protein
LRENTALHTSRPLCALQIRRSHLDDTESCRHGKAKNSEHTEATQVETNTSLTLSMWERMVHSNAEHKTRRETQKAHSFTSTQHTHSQSHSHTYSHSLTHNYTITLTHVLILTHAHTYTHTHTCTLTHSLTYEHSQMCSRHNTNPNANKPVRRGGDEELAVVRVAHLTPMNTEPTVSNSMLPYRTAPPRAPPHRHALYQSTAYLVDWAKVVRERVVRYIAPLLLDVPNANDRMIGGTYQEIATRVNVD